MVPFHKFLSTIAPRRVSIVESIGAGAIWLEIHETGKDDSWSLDECASRNAGSL
jgi:hypothetical protein